MRRLVGVFLVVFGMCSALELNAQEALFKKLSDLPKSWSGESGDLFHRAQMNLTIDSQTMQDSKETLSGFFQNYVVQGKMTVGDQTFGLTKASLSYFGTPNMLELTFWTSDALISRLFVVIIYNEKTGEFAMHDLPKSGSSEKRFILKAHN